MAISSPQPSVLHLVTIFRQITSGDIRIPAFQREFVWKEKQMLELLDSVAEGFPIGSILLWNVDSQMLRIAPAETTSFPAIEEKYPTNYVLDGMQRLSTLYGAFHYGASTQEQLFNIYYDLEGCKFFHAAEYDLFSDKSLPLAALFAPRQLLDQQARINALADGEALIDRLIGLQTAFQEYMVPVVSIRSTDVHRIVGIFEKINSTGTKLDPVDFMRAITWAEDFDLNHHIDDAKETLAVLNYSLDPETIVKCVGLTLGIPPTTDGLLDLRNYAPAQLRQGFAAAKIGLERVASFAAERLRIYASQCIPYEGQILMLFKAVGMQEASPDEEPFIVSWFWASGFNESLRGKPDHYVVRAVENWRGLVHGSVRGLEPRLKLTEQDLYERRLVSGGALSSTFMAMHAAHGARHLGDDELIEPASFMDSSDTAWFEPVFSRAELLEAGLSDTVSARLFGNVVLVDRTKLPPPPPSGVKQWILGAADHDNWRLLDSQFINRGCVESLREGEIVNFMYERASLMRETAALLVATGESHLDDLIG